ncbi:hypothetical protein CKO51_05675 [Rhodopirellula sp. SM50]|nr:hypothetical protein CKO51_05675 [Rhodopirellula sp. SM50]
MTPGLLGFAHRASKDEQQSLFPGFPAEMLRFASCKGIIFAQLGPWRTAVTWSTPGISTVSPMSQLARPTERPNGTIHRLTLPRQWSMA